MYKYMEKRQNDYVHVHVVDEGCSTFLSDKMQIHRDGVKSAKGRGGNLIARESINKRK